MPEELVLLVLIFKTSRTIADSPSKAAKPIFAFTGCGAGTVVKPET